MLQQIQCRERAFSMKSNLSKASNVERKVCNAVWDKTSYSRNATNQMQFRALLIVWRRRQSEKEMDCHYVL